MRIGPRIHARTLVPPKTALRIVLTGGPGAGKTFISNQLADQHRDRFAALPESATIVYQQHQTRWDLLDDENKRQIQRKIYQHQLEQEARLTHIEPARIILLDRGTVDGAAYWPDGPDDYWRDLQTDEQTELFRYDAVIWLQTCAAIGLYDGTASNPCRGEQAEEAILTGQKLSRAWLRHRRLYRVDAYPTMEEKIDMVKRLLELIPARLNPA